MKLVSEIDGQTAAEVMHRRLSSLPASATVGDLRAYFDESSSHRLAVMVDGERFVGALIATSIPDDADADTAAADVADRDHTVLPGSTAREALDLALAHVSHRVPVVDATGTLHGVIAITPDLRGFCGT